MADAEALEVFLILSETIRSAKRSGGEGENNPAANGDYSATGHLANPIGT
jgi:hypothetical protein